MWTLRFHIFRHSAHRWDVLGQGGVVCVQTFVVDTFCSKFSCARNASIIWTGHAHITRARWLFCVALNLHVRGFVFAGRTQRPQCIGAGDVHGGDNPCLLGSLLYFVRTGALHVCWRPRSGSRCAYRITFRSLLLPRSYLSLPIVLSPLISLYA